MMTNGFLIVVALAGLVTLALKCAFIEGQHYFKLPQWFTDSLELVPPAVLCALVIPGIFQDDIGLVNAFGPVVVDPKPIAAGIAAITFFTTKKMIPTLIVGMASLYVVYWLQI
ncbi:AzlD domain-containing protein [Litorivicinus sp.]|nr:AzlD domain-containing protein [Litorivicinus sp.]